MKNDNSKNEISTALILLPQTVLRLWGVESAHKMRYFQAHLPKRYKNDELFELSYYELNQMLLSIMSTKNPIRVDLDKSNIVNEKSVLTDSHILNLSYHYQGLNEVYNPSILSYASDGYNSLVLSDLRFPVPFLRGVIRSKRLYNKFKPKLIYHWDDYAAKKVNQSINLGWEQKFVNSHKILENSKLFIEKFLKEFEEIQDYDPASETIIIYPPVHSTLDSIISLLDRQFTLNKELKHLFFRTDQILVKQHKFCTGVLPKKFIYCMKEIRVANSPRMRALPVEIILLGFQRVTYITVPSSSIFINYHNFKTILWGPKKLKLGYELMLKRHKIKY